MCPCCGVKPDGNRDFVIKPAIHPSKLRHNHFKELGRFLITIIL